MEKFNFQNEVVESSNTPSVDAGFIIGMTFAGFLAGVFIGPFIGPFFIVSFKMFGMDFFKIFPSISENPVGGLLLMGIFGALIGLIGSFVAQVFGPKGKKMVAFAIIILVLMVVIKEIFVYSSF